MYGYSPSMMKFWLNSVQNTLPDPCNLRRWGKQKFAECPLCKWKNCNLVHILCSCKVSLEQGRISWRHDSLLSTIVKYIKQSKKTHSTTDCEREENADKRIRFIKKGKIPYKSKKHVCYWGKEDDWKIGMDTRQKQYHVPPEIASTELRPDICIHSIKAKKVCFIELTSPAEENIDAWKNKKRVKYAELVEEARKNGYKAVCRTIEVGCRGFVSQSSMSVFSMLGFRGKVITSIRRDLSRISIRCSHFIWLNRENKEWASPARVT